MVTAKTLRQLEPKLKTKLSLKKLKRLESRGLIYQVGKDKFRSLDMGDNRTFTVKKGKKK